MTQNPNAAPFDNRVHERTFSDEETLKLVAFIHAGAVIKDAAEKRAVLTYFIKTGRTMGLKTDEFGVYTGDISHKTDIQNPKGPVRLLRGQTAPTHPFAIRRERER